MVMITKHSAPMTGVNRGLGEAAAVHGLHHSTKVRAIVVGLSYLSMLEVRLADPRSSCSRLRRSLGALLKILRGQLRAS